MKTVEDEAAWLQEWLDRPVTQANARGHDVEPDPPAGLTRAERWTCSKCGNAVLRNREVIYGSAVSEDCRRGDEEQQR